MSALLADIIGVRPLRATMRQRGDRRGVEIMNRLSKPPRRRFLLNAGMLAAGWELSSVDAVLTQELAPTPSCRDGDVQTEGRFSSQDRRSAVTCASLVLEAVGSNFLAL